MTTQHTNTAQHTVILSAPPERVFAALTQPEQITRWWGDDSIYWMTNVQQDLRAPAFLLHSARTPAEHNLREFRLVRGREWLHAFARWGDAVGFE